MKTDKLKLCFDIINRQIFKIGEVKISINPVKDIAIWKNPMLAERDAKLKFIKKNPIYLNRYNDIEILFKGDLVKYI